MPYPAQPTTVTGIDERGGLWLDVENAIFINERGEQRLGPVSIKGRRVEPIDGEDQYLNNNWLVKLYRFLKQV